MSDASKLVRRGYAVVGQSNLKETKTIADMMRNYGYMVDTQPDSTWVRLEPVPSMLHLYGPITLSTANHRSQYAPLRRDASDWEEKTPFTYDEPSFDSAMDQFRASSGYARFVALRHVLKMLPPSLLPQFLQSKVAPEFFAAYPQGKIWYVAQPQAAERLSAVVRNLALIKTYGLKEGMKMAKSSGTPVLRAGHARGFADVSASLSVLLSGFSPYVYGFCIGRLSSYIIFQLDEPLAVEPRYPWDVYDFIRPGSLYGEDVAHDVHELITQKFQDPKLVYRSYAHKQIWTPDQFEQLLRWWVKGLDRTLSILVNACTFRDGEHRIDPLRTLIYGLTWDRIQQLTVDILTERNTFIRKTLFFQLLDQYSSLTADHSVKSDEVAMFQKLLKPGHFRATLAPKFASLPAPFGDYLTQLTNELYTDIQSAISDGVWDKTRVSGSMVTMPRWDDATSTFVNKPMSTDDYTAVTLKTIRNTLHGYMLNRHQFEESLFPQRGNISEYFADLCLPLFVCFLADPKSAMHGGWR